MNITIISVGTIKEKYFIDAIKEYSKRMKPFANLTIVEVNEEKTSKNKKLAAREIEDVKDKEGQRILAKIKDKSYVISLCIEGKNISSEQLSEHMESIALEGYADLVFIRGGSYGLSDQVKKRSNYKLSFSKMTFPHQLMRVVLLEQIYRAYKINRNEPYHK